MDGFTGSDLRKRRGVRWWQIPLLPLTFPLSLLVVSFEWLRGIGLLKFFLLFMAVWLVYGEFVVLVDPNAGFREKTSTRAWFLAKVEAPFPKDHLYEYGPRPDCDPRWVRYRPITTWLGAWWTVVLSCDAYAAEWAIWKSGFTYQANWVNRQYNAAIFNFEFDSRLSSSYFYLGLIAFALLFLAVPWYLCYGVWTTVRHVHVGWG